MHTHSASKYHAGLVAGVDTHSDTHTLAILTHVGEVLTTETFPADTRGYRALITALTQTGAVDVIGVEGTNSYGAGLTRALTRAGYSVVEVLRPTRQVRRLNGKSDPIDAVAAARTVRSGHGLSEAKDTETPAESIRYLLTARTQLVQAMTSLIASIRSLLVTADDDVRTTYRDLSTTKLITRLIASRPGTHITDPASAAAYSLRMMAKTYREHAENVDCLEEHMHTLLARHYPRLLAVYGAGTVSAAELAVTAGGNPTRIRNEAAFASLCGACPIPASSGKTHRHRVNHGGDRRGNRALHRIALVRMRHEDRTRTYVEQRLATGKSKKEILRCLKRAIAREVYKALTGPEPVADTRTSRDDLARLRKERGISMTTAARALGTYPARISDIEKNRRPLEALADQYREWLLTA